MSLRVNRIGLIRASVAAAQARVFSKVLGPIAHGLLSVVDPHTRLLLGLLGDLDRALCIVIAL